MTKAGAIAILTTMFLGLSGWTMSEVATIKERVTRNETERDNVKDMIKDIKDTQKEMNHKLDRLLERNK